MSFFSTAWSWLSGNSVSATLAKTAALGYAMRLMSDNVNESSLNKEEVVDPGVRLQLNPDPQNKIPVLYGSAFFGGNITDAELSTDYKTIKYVLTLAEQTGTKLSSSLATTYTFNDVYLNNNRVVFKADGVTVDYTLDSAGNQDINFRDQVKIYMYAGGPKQPVGYSGTTPAATSIMSSWSPSTHPMTGLIYAIVQVTYNRAKNITGIPDCKFHLTSNMTLPGDVLYDYMTNSRYGANIKTAEIDNSLVALNTFCNTGFSYTNPQGQTSTAKIEINGLVDTGTTVMDNMEELAKAGSAWISYDIHQGKWTTVINKSSTAVANFNDSNIIGEISISGTSLTQLNNIADVKYQNANILDKTDYVKVSIPENELFQNEPRSSLQLSLPFTNKQAVALRLGLQLLKQARVDKIINFTADYSYINLRAGDVISVTSSVFGFTNKLFRIVTAEESEGEAGEITVSFSCLEYDANVYVYNIQEFLVETNDGLLDIGAIGKPGTPQVTKFEKDSRPRVLIESTSPTGVVEGLEFWITNDTTLDESNRTYRLLATKYPTDPTTSTWAQGSNVVHEDDTIGTVDFIIKTRGVNSLKVGPYSDPSGIIEFKPVQVTDAIDANTDAFDSTGGLLGALALIDLLGKLSDLFGNDVGKSLFEKIFDVFEDVTGVDLIGEASGGSLVVASDLKTQSKGTDVTAKTSALNFGCGFEVTASGTTADVNLLAGEKENQILVWDGSCWILQDSCCELVIPEPDPCPGDPCSLERVQTWPSDKGRWSLCESPTNVPYTGSYYARYRINPGTESSPAVSASAIPIGKECTIVRPADTDFTFWGAADNNQGTTFTAVQPLANKKVNEIIVGKVYKIDDLGSATKADWESIGWVGNEASVGDEFTATAVGDFDAYVTWAEGKGRVCAPGPANPAIPLYAPLQKGAGSAKLYTSNGDLIETLAASSLKIHNDVVEFPFKNRNPGTDYYILLDEGLVTSCDCESGALTPNSPWNFTTSLTPVTPYEIPKPTKLTPIGPDEKSYQKKLELVSPSPVGSGVCAGGEIALTYSENIKKGSGNITIKKRSTGATVGQYSIAAATINEKTATWTGVGGLEEGESYDVDAPAGLVVTDRPASEVVVCNGSKAYPAGPEVPSEPGSFGFTLKPALKLTHFETCKQGNGNTKIDSNIVLYFNKPIKVKETGPAWVYIYGPFNILHQKIDITGTFDNKKYGDPYYVEESDVNPKPEYPTGGAIFLNPTVKLSSGNYHVEVDAGAIIDPDCNKPWPGIQDSTTVAWKTDGAEATPPQGLTYGSVLMRMEYDRPILPGHAKITIRTPDGKLMTQISARDLAVKIKYNERF